MTPKKAIQWIRNSEFPMTLTQDRYEEFLEAKEMAIEALEKQIPMKHLPAELDWDGKVAYPCGNCGNDINGGDYCPWCGQRVKVV